MKAKYKTIVIDDVPSCIDDVLNVLKDDNRFEVVATADNGLKGVDLIRQHNPDLVLSDIEMPIMNGFDMVLGLKENLNISPTVIFITAYDKYAIQALRCSAFDYILKTQIHKDLPAALNKFANSNNEITQSSFDNQINSLELSLTRNKKIIVKSSLFDNFINPMEIIYINTSSRNANSIYMKNGECITTNQTLAHFEEILSPFDFYRLNRSSIININFIKEIKKETGKLRRKIVHMQLTDFNEKLKIPFGKYEQLIEFIKTNSSPDIIS